MNYPTTTASGTWTNRGGISSYGWDSRQPIDPCSRCTNASPPLPGSQYTTQSLGHNNNYGANDRVSVNGYVSDNRVTTSGYLSDGHVSGYILDNRITGYAGSGDKHNGYNSDNRGGGYSNNIMNRPNDYNSNMHTAANSGYNAGTNFGSNNMHFSDNHVNIYDNQINQIRNPDYRGNGYDNLSPEWNRRHGNKKGGVSGAGGGFGTSNGYIVGSGYNVGVGVTGSGGVTVGNSVGGYNQGMTYPAVVNIPGGQGGAHEQGNYPRPSNNRWNIKGAYPVKVESGYWQSQPPKDIGWDEDSKKVGVIAGWIGGPKKHESTSDPSQTYNAHQTNNKDDDNFNKGTGYDDGNSEQKKPYMGWGGSGSYEVIKMNNGYKYIDRNSNGDYSSNNYGNNYGYGGQSYYNNKPDQDYGSKPINVGHRKPNDHEVQNHIKPTYENHHDHSHNKPPVRDYGSRPATQAHENPPAYDYGIRPHGAAQDWSTSRPIGFEVTSARPPPGWNPQKPNFPGPVASRPTQHWGENSFDEQLGGGSGLTGYNNRPGGNHVIAGSLAGGYESPRPEYGYGTSRPDHSFSRPGHDYASLRPDNHYGSARPSTGGEDGPLNFGASRPFVGSVHQTSAAGHGSQTSEFDKFGGFSDNGSGSYRPQTSSRPNYDDDRLLMNGNDVYGSQHQSQSDLGHSKGYASNWDYYSNSMR